MLTQAYCSLVRSVIDYSSFILFVINEESKNRLQVIQNNCLRVILNANFDKNTQKNVEIDVLHKKAKLQTVEERSNTMLIRYLTKAIDTNNELIIDAINSHNDQHGTCKFCNNQPRNKLNINR